MVSVHVIVTAGLAAFRELGTAVLEAEGSGIAALVSILKLTIGASRYLSKHLQFLERRDLMQSLLRPAP
jgi:hypothetical protein